MISYEDADKIYFNTFYGGRKKGCPTQEHYRFPFGNRYKNDVFVEVQFPTAPINTRLIRPELVPEYAERMESGDEFPAVWLSLGRLMTNGDVVLHWDRKVKVMDGFHRITAAKSLGYETIKAIMPKSHWEFFQTLKVVEDELYHKD